MPDDVYEEGSILPWVNPNAHLAHRLQLQASCSIVAARELYFFLGKGGELSRRQMPRHLAPHPSSLILIIGVQRAVRCTMSPDFVYILFKSAEREHVFNTVTGTDHFAQPGAAVVAGTSATACQDGSSTSQEHNRRTQYPLQTKGINS